MSQNRATGRGLTELHASTDGCLESRKFCNRRKDLTSKSPSNDYCTFCHQGCVRRQRSGRVQNTRSGRIHLCDGMILYAVLFHQVPVCVLEWCRKSPQSWAVCAIVGNASEFCCVTSWAEWCWIVFGVVCTRLAVMRHWRICSTAHGAYKYFMARTVRNFR